MKQFLLLISVFPFMANARISSLPSPALSSTGPGFELYAGYGRYYSYDAFKGKTYITGINYRIGNWCIGLQGQESRVKDDRWDINHENRDFDLTCFLGRSFFKGRNLRISAGFGYSWTGYRYRIPKYKGYFCYPSQLMEGDVLETRYDKSFTVPVKVDLRLIRYKSIRVGLTAGGFYDTRIYTGLTTTLAL
jgi:hypothetical protein